MSRQYIPYNHNSQQDIKKGLQKIKQAQLEVLRELRKEQSQAGNSNTDSYEARKKESPQMTNIYRQRIQQLEDDMETYMLKQKKLRQQNIRMGEEMKEKQEMIRDLQRAVKKLEQSENDHLEKAQQALKNAIASQKKYISLKAEFQKICQQKESIHSDLKTIQLKQFDRLIQTQDQIYSQLAKDVSSLNEIHQKIYHSSKSNKKSQQKLQLHQQFEKNISKILIYLTHGQQNFPHPQNQQTENNYLSGSFQQDMKIIQEQLNKGQNYQRQKMSQLQAEINKLTQTNKRLKQEIQQNEQENQILRNRVRAQARQIDELKLNKRVVEEQYEDYKKKIKQKLKAKEVEQQKIQNLQREMNSSTREKQSLKKEYDLTMKKMEQKLKQREQEVQKMKNSHKKFQSIIERLKNQIQSLKTQKKHQQQQHQFQLAKINAQIKQISSINMRDQREWRQMMDSIRKLQQQRANLIMTEKQKQTKLREIERNKQKQVAYFNSVINQMQGVIQNLRKQNSEINYERSELIRLRKKVEEKNVNHGYDRVVDELWHLKESQYEDINRIMMDLVHVPLTPTIQTHQFYYRRQW